MAEASQNTPATHLGATRPPASFSAPFGIPLGDLGFFATLIMSVALAFGAFFLATFVSILVLLGTASSGHHPVDYAASYRHVGLPVGVVVGVLAFGYLGTLWTRRVLRRA